MNPMQAVTEEEDQETYSDEDINQGFWFRHDFHPLETQRATNDFRLNRLHTTV